MKQFWLDYPPGKKLTFDLDSATECYGSEVTKGLDGLAVGESCVDCDGDTWTRLPDVGDEPQSADQARRERREHLASIAFAGLLARVTIMPVPHKDLAEDAIAAADALIDALDASE